MTFPDRILGDLRVAYPCEVNWDDMEGSERVRHCSTCRLHVYNLSNLTRQQAQNLVEGAEGRLCVRFYRRADGSVMTQDCSLREQVPVPRRWKPAALLASFVFFILGAIALSAFGNDSPHRRITELPVIGRVFHWFGFDPPERCVMGMMPAPRAMPAPQQQEAGDPMPC